MVPSASPGTWLLPAGRVWQRQEEKLKEGKVTKVKSAEGKGRHVFNVIAMLLCWSVVRTNQRIPTDALAPTAVEVAVPQC